MKKGGVGQVGEVGGCCPISGCTGRMRVEYTSEHLYLQLLYLHKLFDIKSAYKQVVELRANGV